jgi:hypothetical protein
LWGGETEHPFVRRFPGFARSSCWYEYNEMEMNEAEDVKKERKEPASAVHILKFERY